jgi:predicted Zn-dependent protease
MSRRRKLDALNLEHLGGEMREIALIPNLLRLCRALIALLVASALSACGTVPITGRSQLNVLSDAEIRAMGEQSFSSFMSFARKGNLVLNANESPQAAAANNMVRRVSNRIIDAAGLRGQYNWETVVIKARETNAFVTPNGKIVVFVGLLPVAKSDAGLAAVIGHEVAHVIARHGAERVSQTLVAQMAIAAADVALAARNSRYQPVVSAGLGLGAQYGILLPFSREHESEADRIGLLYMAKAGYDPGEAIGLWERMEATNKGGRWEFLSTHPSPATRRDQIRSWLPEANLYYADRNRPLPSNIAELQKARADHSARVALAPAALRPEWQTGFWYRTKQSKAQNPVTHRYTRNQDCETGQCLLIEADSGSATLYTADFAIAAFRNAVGAWTKFSPPLRMMAWPLRVGDSWSQEVTIENPEGRRQTAPVKVDVLGYEAVTVPAGSFMAFKVIVAIRGVRFLEGWYAPEIRTLVRSVAYDSQGNQAVSELLDYQRVN